MHNTTHSTTFLTELVVRQIEDLLNEVGPNDAVIIQKHEGHIHGFVKQANIRVKEDMPPITITLDTH